MRITEENIIDVLQHREEKEAAIRQQMQQFLDEISRIESAEYEYDLLREVSLKGKDSDSIRSSKTYKHMDTYQILEQFQTQQRQEIGRYQERFRERADELLFLEKIWRIYNGLDFRLYKVLKMRYVENQKWKAISSEMSLSNRRIAAWTKTAVQAILYELTHGEGTSRKPDFTESAGYGAVLSETTKKKKSLEIPGQMQMEELGK